MSEIRRAMKALERMVAQVGMNNIPIGNEKLRPLLIVMQDVAMRHSSGVMVFEMGENVDTNKLPDRLQLGLIIRLGEFQIYRRELDEAMSDEVIAAVKANDKRILARMMGPAVAMYHEELWIPSAVLLPERKH
jgi:hypothetical protein